MGLGFIITNLAWIKVNDLIDNALNDVNSFRGTGVLFGNSKREKHYHNPLPFHNNMITFLK